MIAFDGAKINISDNLDRNTVPDLVDIDIPFKQHAQWQVDLKQAGRVDSAGLALLLHWLNRAKQAGVSLGVINPTEDFTGLVKLCKVDELILR